MPEGTPAGLVLVDKPAGISSFGAISRLRPIYGKKLGHAGTLDPFATGLLLVLTGRATRLASYLVGADKTYEATIQFGARSTTEDPEGEIQQSGCRTSEVAIAEAIPSLTGEIDQVPPAASAIHIDGERAYRRFRRGETVTVPTRRVVVHAFTLRRFDPDSQQAMVTVRCGSGTYIRSLARDLGELVETGAHLIQLRRTEVGAFSVDDAATPDAIASDVAGARSWLPARAAVAALRQVPLSSDELGIVRNGGRISVDPDWTGDVALVDQTGDLIAIASTDAGVAAPKIVLVPS